MGPSAKKDSPAVLEISFGRLYVNMVPPPSYFPGRSIAQFPLMMERPERLRKAVEKNESPQVSPGVHKKLTAPYLLAYSFIRFVIMIHYVQGTGLGPGAGWGI